MAKYSAAVDAGGGGLNDMIMQMPKALQRLFAPALLTLTTS
jgi:hypothetical protein